MGQLSPVVAIGFCTLHESDGSQAHSKVLMQPPASHWRTGRPSRRRSTTSPKPTGTALLPAQLRLGAPTASRREGRPRRVAHAGGDRSEGTLYLGGHPLLVTGAEGMCYAGGPNNGGLIMGSTRPAMQSVAHWGANPSEFEFRALLYGTWSWAVLDYDSNVSPVAPRSPVLWQCVTYTAHAHVSMSASL